MKYACISAEGRVVHQCTVPVRYAARVEQSDVRRWFDELLKQIGRIPPEVRRAICAIVVSGQGPSLIPIDSAGTVLRPLLFRSLLDDGRPPAVHTPVARPRSHYIPFATQYIRQDPSLRERAHIWIPIPEYFVYLLCGEAISMLLSPRYRRYYWTASALRRARLPAERFPRHRYMGEVVASLSAEVATRHALPPRIPIIAGGLDFCMAIIGARSMRRRAVCDRAGSTQGLNFIGYRRRRHALLQSYPLLSAATANQSLLILNSGALVADLHDSEPEQLRRFVSDEPLTTPPLLPMVKARGVVEIASPADSADHTDSAGRTDTADRAARISRLRCLESILFTMRYVVELFPARQRKRMSLALCGGQTHVEKWNALKADVLGVRCHLFQCAHTELLGAAAVAFTTLGVYRRLPSAVAHISHLRTSLSARPLVTLPRYRAFCTALTRRLAVGDASASESAAY